jgi:hypothetical protein
MKKITILLVAFTFLFSTVASIAQPVARDRSIDKGTGKPAWTIKDPVSEPEADPADGTMDEPLADPIEDPVPVLEVEPGDLASTYGLVPDDLGARDTNASLFNQALNEHGRIVIDGAYYIGRTSVKVTNPNIEVIGLGNGELIFNNDRGTSLFDPNRIENLTLRNVKFTNLNESSNVLIVYSGERDTGKVNSVMIEGCTFAGNISAYRQQGDTSLDPGRVDFGINEFVFRNNQVSNTGLTFIRLTDIPFDKVEISDNRIRNFTYVFAHMGITNGITYGTEVRNARKLIRVTNNDVRNEDHWWTKDQTYHAFVLTENVEVVYDSNHVEGLKADFDAALYDAYLSSDVVTYTNNTWKNNIAFAPDKRFNTLIKAKTGRNNPSRLYANNRFIVEESFAERLGKPKEELYVHFIDINTYMESFIIENNLIDVYDIRFPSSSRYVKEFTFSHNTLKAQYMSGRMVILRVTDDYQSTIRFNNNHINITQTQLHPTSNADSGLIQIADYREGTAGNLVKRIEFKDNVIRAPFRYFFYSPLAETIVVENNQLIVVGDLYRKFVSGSDGGHVSLKNVEVTKI